MLYKGEVFKLYFPILSMPEDDAIPLVPPIPSEPKAKPVMALETIDLSLPYPGDLEAKIHAEDSKTVTLKLIPPANSRFTYDAKPLSHIKLSRSAFDSAFHQNGSGLYCCSGASFADLVDDYRDSPKNPKGRKA